RLLYDSRVQLQSRAIPRHIACQETYMSDWAVGLSTGCFWQTSVFECLEDIRNSGFGRIEICSFPAHLDYHDIDRVKRAAQRIDELGLETYSFHAPFSDS